MAHIRCPIALLVVLLAGCTPRPPPMPPPVVPVVTAKVVSVSDGDTLTVLTSDNVQLKVRLHGIDCPERGQPWGNRAKQFTGDAAFGEVVAVEVVDRDRYGRLVAVVTLPDGRVAVLFEKDGKRKLGFMILPAPPAEPPADAAK